MKRKYKLKIWKFYLIVICIYDFWILIKQTIKREPLKKFLVLELIEIQKI